MLSPKPADWSRFLASGVKVSDDFIANLEDLLLQERDSA